jgi:transposase
MTPAAAAILEGMTDPKLLRRTEHDGITYIMAGSALLSRYPSDDAGMRNIAVAALRQLGFGGQAVAGLLGLSENYVATLHNRALREGLPGLVRESGRPRKLPEAAWARRWRSAGSGDGEIAARLGVDRSTVSRRLAGTGRQEQLGEAEPGARPQRRDAAAAGEAAARARPRA